MLRFKYSILFSIPLLLSGCIIVDADRIEPDVRAVTVVHEKGEESEAFRSAERQCDRYGGEPTIISVEDDYTDGKIRTTFECD